MIQSRNSELAFDDFQYYLTFAVSIRDHVMLLQMYRQLFCTIDERHLTLYKYDFLPLFEYKFFQTW